MIRQYYSATNRLRQAALLIGNGPTLVSVPARPHVTRSQSSWIVGAVIAGTVALLVVWILLRRSAARARQVPRTPRATGPAPLSLADDLATWAAEQPEQPGDTGSNADSAGDDQAREADRPDHAGEP
jgi:hypothetical protein